MALLKLTRPIAFIDLETTGVDTNKDRIVEIGILKINPDSSREEFLKRTNPTIPIPPDATKVHGISNDDIKDAPKFSEIASEIAQFIDDSDLGGFNCNRFDFPMLAEEFGRAGVQFDFSKRKIVDVQRIFHQMERRDLSAAVEFYCNKKLVDAHSALGDVVATFEVLEAQLDRYSTLQNDIDWLHNFTAQRDGVDMNRRMMMVNGEETINFGKHKGKSVRDLLRSEPQYFDWIFKSDFPMEFKQKLKEVIASKK